jgi:diguanylate cyclase (GGDEF)-like protein
MDSAKKRIAILWEYVQLGLGLSFWCAIALLGPPGTFVPGGEAIPAIGSLGPTISLWLTMAWAFAFSWAAVRVKFRMGEGYFVSFDMSFAIAAFFLVSPAAGVLLSIITMLVDFYYRVKEKGRIDHPLIVTLCSNLGNRLLRLGFAWLAFMLAGGVSPPTPDESQLGPALVAFLAYFLSNNLFYLPKEYLSGSSMKAFLRESLTVDLVHSFAICSLGMLLALVALRMGFALSALVGGFVLAASWLMSTLTKTQAQLKGRVEDLTILSKVSASANTGLDVMPMVESFTRALADSLPADGIGVVFYQRYATTIYLVQVEGGKSRSTYLPEEKRFQYDQLPLSEPSVRLGERLFEFLQPLETAPFCIPPSVFGLPLLHGGEPFGGIVVYSYKEDIPLNAREWLLETSAQTLVVALENCFLHLQAIQDSLTGLFNRSYFLYRLEEELAYSSRHRAPFALLMLDLDDFKAVNDRLGHSEGDKVIHRIGDLIRRATRREDVPARYGGDEFILLLLNCPLKDAMDKADRIRSIIASRALPKEEAFGLHLGCSVSLLHSDNLKGEQDVPNILRRLDDALYHAKEKGKNQVVRVE